MKNWIRSFLEFRRNPVVFEEKPSPNCFNMDMARIGRNILLLLDNAPSHVATGLNLSSVKVLLFPPNTTSKFKPKDAGIIASFKARYLRRQIEQAFLLDAEDAKDNCKVDVLQAMRWILMAWDEITS